MDHGPSAASTLEMAYTRHFSWLVEVSEIEVVWMFWLEAMSVGTVLFAGTEAGEYQQGWVSMENTRGRWESWL